MKTKKLLAILAAATLAATSLASCGNTSTNNDANQGSAAGGFDTSAAISVISREEGSGTRGAFIELFEIEEKDANGDKVDKTIDSAAITSSTGVMLTSVAGDKNAIGYISLGALNDTVKALKIDGAEATVENIKADTYKVKRPFNIITKKGLSDVAQDFVDFILSKEGQEVIEKDGYIASVENAPAYAGKKPSGTVKVAGSSSVTPVMEKLQEAYVKINTNAKIEVNQSDSTTGVSSAATGVCDIGMASRELKDSEKADDITATVIAIDGIAVIVNKDNSADSLSSEAVKGIYTGEFTKWSDVIK